MPFVVQRQLNQCPKIQYFHFFFHLLLLFLQSVNRYHVRHRAAGIHAGKQNGFFRAKDICGFSHKMNPGKKYYLSFCFGRLHGKPQRITGNIGNFLNFRTLIIVGQKKSVPLFDQFPDFGLQFFLIHYSSSKSRIL